MIRPVIRKVLKDLWNFIYQEFHAKDLYVQLPSEYRDEYDVRQTELFDSRVPLLCVTATFLFFAVSIQYLLRKKLLHMNTYRSAELWVWAFLIAGVSFVLYLHRRASTLREYRFNAYTFSVIFVSSLTVLGLIYPETAAIFPFYIAFAFLLSSLMIPWKLSDLRILALFYLGAHTALYFYIRLMTSQPLIGYPRFQPYADGTIFIGIAYVMGMVLRKKEIEKDIQNFILFKQVEEKNRQIDQELELAAHIHQTLIPASIRSEKVNITVTYIPMRRVGGDYAKFRFLDNDRLIFFISDVTGHGVPAALLVNRMHAEFERLSKETESPGILLDELNRFILKTFDGTNMYLSAFCGLLDFRDMRFSYSNYGHPDQYLYHRRRSMVQSLKSDAGLMGLPFGQEEHVKDKQILFEEGDSILLFTDGLIEATNDSGENYGEGRLVEFLKNNPELLDEKINEKLISDLEHFKSGNFNDDVFIVNIQTNKVKTPIQPKLAATSAS